MSKSTFELRGRVVQTGTDNGIPDLRVILADQESQIPSMMFRGITDKSGEFCIDLSQEDAARLFDPGTSGRIWSTTGIFYISVYNGDALLTTTQDRIQMSDLARGRLPRVIEVGLASSIQFSVHGRVVNADGSPVANARIRVEHVELGNRTLLGSATTDRGGAFDIEYSGADESTATATNMAVVVTATDAAAGTEIARTPVITDPRPRHKVDLLTSDISEYKGQPEYSRVSAAIAAETSDVLSAEDLEVLVARTGLTADQVAMVIQAERIASARGIPVEASYALMRAGLPADVPGQLAQSSETIRTALQKAVDNNLVDAAAYDVERVVSLYTTSKVEAVLSGTDRTIVDLVATSGLSSRTTDRFLTRWVEHEGMRDEFWAGLLADSEFTTAEVETLQFTTEATAILDGFQPALAALQAERTTGNIASTRDLAGWEASDWSSFVATNGAPDDLPGDRDEREALYAATLDRVTEEQFPTERVARRFQRSPLAETLGVPEFLDANHDFDITKTVVAGYFEQNPSAVPSGFDIATTEANLKRVQRVFTLTPRFHRYAVARVLMDQGIDSAASIVHIGKANFVDRFSPQLEGVHDGMSGEQVAKSVYASALQKHGFSLALMAQYGASMNTIAIDAIPATTMAGDEGPGAATLASLFGSLDYCACEHCRSMFSPAAYLVDLLSCLEAVDAYTAFYSRRGDIAHLELSCENTNTVLPYIDIVNEILEDAVQNPGVRPTTRQTTWSAEELRLNPEPTDNDAAYDLCAAAAYPWSLPVDVPAVEIREHLERLGFSRAEAMELFAEDGVGVVISEDARTAERLGMSTLEFELATQGPAIPGAVPGWRRWGFDFSDSGVWLDMLASDVPRVLDVTGLSFEAFTRLLTMRTVTNDFAVSPDLEIGPPGDEPPTCDLNELSVRGFDDRAADSIHRFLRISRRVDASWHELDIMLEAFGGMTAGTLRSIADALEVRDSLGIPLDEGIWSNLDEHSYDSAPSVFSRMFQSNKVLAEAAGEFSLGGTLEEAQHYAHLRSGLGINDADLRLLLGVLDIADGDTLDIALVSSLYTHTRLADALGLRVGGLLRYLDLVDFDAFASPADTLSFAKIVRRTETLSLGIDGVEYLCRHRFAPEHGFHPTTAELDVVLRDIAGGKTDVEAQLDAVGTPGEIVRIHLEALLGLTGEASEVLRILEAVPLPPGNDAGDGEFIREQLGTLGVDIDAAPAPVGDPPDLDPRYTFVANELQRVRRERGYRAVILERLVVFSSLPADAVVILATQLVTTQLDSVVSIYETLFDDSGDHYTALLQFHKAAMLVTGLGVEARDLAWIFTPVDPTAAGAGADTMGLGSLPLTQIDAADAAPIFTQLRAVQLWAELLADFTTSSEELQAISAELPATRAHLAAVSGWNQDDLSWVGSTTWFALDGDALRDPFRVAQLRDMGIAVRRTGARAEQLAAWARNAPNAQSARDSKQALRARHSEASWPDVIQPISDSTRELRRDALLDYLVADPFFDSRQAVYAYYLLDPEMNACMMTSRLKLAISSVQLFVQRGLMQLEPEVSFSPSFAREWEWRKNYRVWEANRKVFFYPENWIVPELRSDKTPFFRELEAHIQQGEVTNAHVEQGFKNYLYKLHQVANLAILDIHEVYDAETRQDVVHIVGRTQAEPYKYFYRKKVGVTHWTPWEPVEAGVSGEHLLLRSFNDRLFLFWLEFSEDSVKTDGDKSKRRLQFSLASTERKNGSWAPKKVSSPSRWSTKSRSKRNYGLWGQLEEGGAGPVVSVFYAVNVVEELGQPADVWKHFELKVRKWWDYRYNACRDSFVALGERAANHPTTEAVMGARAYAIRAQRLKDHEVRLRAVDTTDHLVIGYDGPGEFLITPSHQGPTHAPVFRPYAIQSRSSTVLATPVAGAGGGFSVDISTRNSATIEFAPKTEAVGTFPDSWNDSSAAFNAGYKLVTTDAEVIAASVVAQAQIDLGVAHHVQTATAASQPYVSDRIDIEALSHPLTCSMLKAVNKGGVTALLAPTAGGLRRQHRQYQLFVRAGEDVVLQGPVSAVPISPFGRQPFPLAEFDFDLDSANSVYNWELFFHAPLMIANRLRSEGRFEDADCWCRYIFNPVSGLDSEEAYGPETRPWMVKPLFRESLAGEPDVVQSIFSNDGLAAEGAVLSSFLKSVARWMYDPFNPHAIASVRSGTYRWVALRAYLDNLLDWGDALFRRDTIESINEATQLYMLVAMLLGRKPVEVHEQNVQVEHYSTLDLAGLFGGLAEMEGFYPAQDSIGSFNGASGGVPVAPPEPPAYDTTLFGNSSGGGGRPLSGPTAFAGQDDGDDTGFPTPQNWAAIPPSGLDAIHWWTFCLPPNPQLLEYWDRVADRLFKIRNCQNIKGVERSLALFEAPIDPALLVRARAAGLDFASAVDGLNATLPYYRYRILTARAVELCNDVRALGGALLSALEKRDVESLSRLRSSHESAVLSRMRAVRLKQVKEAGAQILALGKAEDSASARVSDYRSRKPVSEKEELQIDNSIKSAEERIFQQENSLIGQILSALPNLGFVGIVPSVSFGGSNFAAAYQAGSGVFDSLAIKWETESSLAGIRASQDRRWEEWQHQLELAMIDKQQIKKQIIAAEIREAIAQKELSNHDRQIEQAKEVQAFYQDKFSNEELYDWMIGEISRLYYQAYKLAFDMAKKAERAMQFELETDDTFIEFGYWDGLKKGLIAGERLHLDMKRMESAYLEKDKRELELTKRLSLRQIAPEALRQLQEDGECEYEIPEVLFDLDHAGHYLRRSRAVRLTIPAVAGPQTSIGATLTLLRDDLRTAPSLDESTVRTTYGGTKQIATSHAREDGGMFELNFRDERYLPFEGAGVSSRWSLRLPTRVRQFDYNTISDVEIRIDYTARDGGSVYRHTVEETLQTQLTAALADANEQGIALVLSAKKDFAVEWERFLRPADGQTQSQMDVPITLERFPYVIRGLSPQVHSVDAVLVGEGYEATGAEGELSTPDGVAASMRGADGAFSVANVDVAVDHQPWGLDLGAAVEVTDPDGIEDLWVIVRFTVTIPNN